MGKVNPHKFWVDSDLKVWAIDQQQPVLTTLTKGMESWRVKNRKCHSSVIHYVATSSHEIKLFHKTAMVKLTVIRLDSVLQIHLLNKLSELIVPLATKLS